MICEACKKREAVVDWTSFSPAERREEHVWLCEACAEARMPPDALKRIQEARARGDTGAISGWTGYTPETDEKP